MSRTLVDIPANMLTQLTELAKKLDISRAELMRKILSTELQAIEAVLQEHSQQADSPNQKPFRQPQRIFVVSPIWTHS
ncbi:MAG: hypothetical protein ABS69_08885 [Nitrosomonadales bacterium SCN 54-20]|nr:MAG: hypothetical protein ABS69_08885 [Nitrosomonadales bacterium SCN 54-20]